MSKVIVERPRRKGWAWNKPKGYQRRLRQYGEDGPPQREPIKGPWQSHTKDLNEHLSPLRRYLDSQVGRPWSKVYSEICAHIDRNSAVQDHVRDHVDGYVTVNVILIDGVPCSGEGNRGYGQPLSGARWRPWYVCPKSGLLKRVKRGRRPRLPISEPAQRPRFVRLTENEQCRLIKGIWHLVTLKALPLDLKGRHERDVVLNRRLYELSEEIAREQYGTESYAVAMRPLSRRELSQLPVPMDEWQ